MRIGKYEHKPSLTIVLLFLLFVAALLSLGTWQMQRAALKTDILAKASQARATAAVSSAHITDVKSAANAHRLVTVTGVYRGNTQFLWDNRVHRGQAGFEVITPVRTANGIVLVNRGWVPPGLTRQDLPDVAMSDDLTGVTVTITGLFSRPSKGLISGKAMDDNATWPRVLQYFDYASIEQALGETVLAGVVQPQQKITAKRKAVLASRSAEIVGAGDESTSGANTDDANLDVSRDESSEDEESALSNRAEFYIANWEPVASIGPARHYGYAFQWYAMAFALTILYIVYNTKRVEPA